MGHFDRKNYIISVKLRESCSDQRIIDWQLERDYSYATDEVKVFEPSLNDIFVEYAGAQV